MDAGQARSAQGCELELKPNLPTLSGCWAADLSPCKGKLSSEHIASKSLFDKSVTVQGSRYLLTTKMGINSFTTKCLCEGHNSGFSHLDQVAKNSKYAIERFHAVKPTAGIGTIPTFSLVGTTLARWIVKFTTNVYATGNKLLPMSFRRLVSHQWPHEIGIFTPAKPGMNLRINSDQIGLRTLLGTEQNPQVIAACYFNGIFFIVSPIDPSMFGPAQLAYLGIDADEPIPFINRIRRFVVADGHRTIATLKVRW